MAFTLRILALALVICAVSFAERDLLCENVVTDGRLPANPIRRLNDLLAEARALRISPTQTTGGEWHFNGLVAAHPPANLPNRALFGNGRGDGATADLMIVPVAELLRLNPALARRMQAAGLVFGNDGRIHETAPGATLPAGDPRGQQGEWRNYVVWADGYPVDSAFGWSMHDAVAEVVTMMGAREPGGPETFDTVREISTLIAHRQNEANSDKRFGKLSERGVMTGLSGERYDPWAIRLLRRAGILGPNQTVSDLPTGYWGGRVEATTFDGTRVVLGDWFYERFITDGTVNYSRGMFNHARPGTRNAIDAHLNHLLQRLRTQTLTRSQIVETAGEMHWWLAHMVRFERGSASNSHAVVNAILIDMGFVVSPPRQGIVPDIEALSQPDVAAFRSAYGSLFVVPPHRR